MPIKPSLLLSLILLFGASAAHAQTRWLVSPEETQASMSAPEPLTPRSGAPAPGAPRVNLLAPNITSNVSSPTPIRVRFEATAPASINPDSFKVRYGAMRIDITNRITAASRVTADGIDVAEAALPRGSHRLFIEIQDSLGRVGERAVAFVVE